MDAGLSAAETEAGRILRPSGRWIASHAAALDRAIEALPPAPAGVGSAVILDLAGLTGLDTFGAGLVDGLAERAGRPGGRVEIANLPEAFRGLFEAVQRARRLEPAPPPPRGWRHRLARLAAALDAGVEDGLRFLDMTGRIGLAAGAVLLHPRRLRPISVIHHLDRVGLQAVPIMVLITLLIGGIIAQQGIFHFRKFGAETYVVDLVGILVLREIGVLIVAIMVAGRSGSSYTAELGAMKMREEVDALRTMGLDPIEVLVLPRVLALLVALPVLAFIGALSALIGGGFTAWIYGGMSPATFLIRLRDAISVTHFEVGMLKAPFMALVIGVVASTEGLNVAGSAESLGLRTTASVVKAIFLVIVLDGLFAMIFAAMGM